MSIFSFLFKNTFSKPKVLNGTDRDFIRSQWMNIDSLVKVGKPSTLRQAIIEADKLLEFTLKKLINDEQSLGENLKLAKDKFPSWAAYQMAWEAHKVRNALVHEAGFEPNHSLAKEAIEKFRQSLVSLGVL